MKHWKRMALAVALCLLAAALAIPALAYGEDGYYNHFTWPKPPAKGYVEHKIDGTTYRRYDDGHVGIYKTTGALEDVFQVPQAVGDQPVTTVDGRAFKDQDQLTGVVVPEGVTGIGDRAFMGCASLAKVSLPASVTDLGKSLFYLVKTPVTVYYAGTDPEIIAQLEKMLPKGSQVVSGHAHAIANETTPATCTKAGAHVRSCACGLEMARKVFPALGHDLEVKKKGWAATCTEKGKTNKTWCRRCGKTFESKTIPALGHVWSEWTRTQEPTCAAAGEDGYACLRCGATETRVVPALGHELVDHEAKAATCTEVGWDAYQTCSRCDYTTYVEIPALGHGLVDHEAKAATCTEVGWDAYQTCSRCDYTTYVEIPALGHDLVDHEAKAATCTEVGWDAYQTCSRCDYTTYVEIPALGHTGGTATCEARAVCTRCGEEYGEKGAHTSGEPAPEDVVKATCKDGGSYNRVTRCSVCGEKLESVAVQTEKDPNNHTGGEKRYVSEGADGYHYRVVCLSCGGNKEKGVIPFVNEKGGANDPPDGEWEKPEEENNGEGGNGEGGTDVNGGGENGGGENGGSVVVEEPLKE